MPNSDVYGIGLITIPLSDAGVVPLSQLIDICSNLSGNLYLITGNQGYKAQTVNSPIVKVSCIYYKNKNNLFLKLVNYFILQVRQGYNLALTRNVKTWIFFIGGSNLLIPMIIAKIKRKQVILFFAGSSVETYKAKKDKKFIILEMLENCTCHLADKIVLYSSRHISEWNLNEFEGKISIAYQHFINLDKFYISKSIGKRDHVVGYVGRLNPEKGVMNFLKAINILKNKLNLKYIIVGDGPLRDTMHSYCRDHKLENIVEFIGWVSHDDLPEYLNMIRLLVVPSFTEGLPNIILESMACGTVVLATPVGSIPDILEDNSTGFLMENNSPECIADNIIRANDNPNVKHIISKSERLIKENFVFGSVVGQWEKLIRRE